MKQAVPIYIGFDEREAEAANVCKHSLLRHTSIPVLPIMLKESVLREIGLYDRTFYEEKGVRYDTRDSKPFSTDFAFSRFLVPAHSLYSGWSVFMDCDMMFRGDIAELLKIADPKYAVQVVKHNYQPTETVKMDGQKQQVYPRKNWSSFMLFNNDHPSNRNLTVNAVNIENGRWLHGFGWLKDEEIGELSAEWNYLVGWHSRKDVSEPMVCHWTSGGPWFDEYRNVEFANEWFAERDLMNK